MIMECNKPVDAVQLSALRQSVGWPGMEKENSNPQLTSYYHVACYESNNLIAFVDVVSNGVTDAYIQDVIVHPRYQRKGLGTDLMHKVIDYLKEKHIFMISVIYGEANLKGFYEKFGFFTMLCGQMETYRLQ